jgi:hypothetical protein
MYIVRGGPWDGYVDTTKLRYVVSLEDVHIGNIAKCVNQPNAVLYSPDCLGIRASRLARQIHRLIWEQIECSLFQTEWFPFFLSRIFGIFLDIKGPDASVNNHNDLGAPGNGATGVGKNGHRPNWLTSLYAPHQMKVSDTNPRTLFKPQGVLCGFDTGFRVVSGGLQLVRSIGNPPVNIFSRVRELLGSVGLVVEASACPLA